MTDEEIIPKMYELANKIGYEPQNISHLKDAMHCQKIHQGGDGKNRDNYTNASMATLGDAILKLILSEYYFDRGYGKKEITDEKKQIEKNEELFKLCDRSGLFNYAYDDKNFYPDAPKNRKVPHPKHDIYVEAIIAAIYKDKGYDYCKEWVIKFLHKNNLLK